MLEFSARKPLIIVLFNLDWRAHAGVFGTLFDNV